MGNNSSPNIGKKVGIIGVPLGYGAGQTGSELGVEAIRLSKFRGGVLTHHIRSLGYDVEDYGNSDIVRSQETGPATTHPKYLQEMTASCRNIAGDVKRILDDGALPVILGGDHSIAIGTFSGIASHYRERGEDVGLIWFDAHADINTPETSPSGNIHGMPLSILLGHGPEQLVNLGGFAPKLKPQFIAHVGGRDLDRGEQQRVRELGLKDHFFTMSDIDKRGIMACVEDAIAIASRASGGYAVTFDIDVIDPRFAPG